MSARNHRRGMALLTVVLLVALLSAVTTQAVEDVGAGVRRTGNAVETAQARWHVLAAENFVKLQLRRLRASSPGRTTLAGGWLGREAPFPLEGGGLLVRLDDAGNCFNLNVLRKLDPSDFGGDATEEPPSAQEAAAANSPRLQFLALLAALDVPRSDGEEIADAVADWLDADAFRTGAGFEDDHYLRRAIPHRTGAGNFAEASELRAVEGVTPAIYDALRPYVCAHPYEAGVRLNVNTLLPEQAVLLTAITQGAVSIGQARAVIARRPAVGYDTLDAFWNELGAGGLSAVPHIRANTALETRYFRLTTRVRYGRVEWLATSLLDQSDDLLIRTRYRRWTLEE